MKAQLRRWSDERFPHGTLRRRLVKGVFWVLTGSASVQILGAIASIAIAQLLGKEGFGDYGIVRNTMVMMGVFAGLGLGMSANKYLAEFRHNDPRRAGRILGLVFSLGTLVSVVLAVSLFLLADWLATDWLHAPHLGNILRLAAPLLLATSVNSIQTSALSGFEAFRPLTIGNLLNAAAGAACIVFGSWVAGLRGAVWGSLVAAVIAVIVLEVIGAQQRRRLQIPIVWSGAWQEWQVVKDFALPAFLSSVLFQPVTWLVAALLYAQPEGRGETGIFNAANQWRNIVLFVPAAIGQVAMPILTSLYAQGAGRGYSRTLLANGLASLLIGLVVGAPLAIASPWILRAYGPGFESGALAMCLLIASAVMQACNSVIGQSLASTGRMWWGFTLNLLWAIELYAAARMLISHGATGLAAAYLIAYTLHTVQVGAFTYFDLRTKLPNSSPPSALFES